MTKVKKKSTKFEKNQVKKVIKTKVKNKGSKKSQKKTKKKFKEGSQRIEYESIILQRYHGFFFFSEKLQVSNSVKFTAVK